MREEFFFHSESSKQLYLFPKTTLVKISQIMYNKTIEVNYLVLLALFPLRHCIASISVASQLLSVRISTDAIPWFAAVLLCFLPLSLCLVFSLYSYVSVCFSFEDINNNRVRPSLAIWSSFIVSLLYFQIKLHSRSQVLELQFPFSGESRFRS